MAASWTVYELVDGERVEGVVVQIPKVGAANGNRLFLRRADGDTIAIDATAKRGHTVLERQLRELRVKPGNTISITYFGKCRTLDGEREYRNYSVEVIA
jgi:hypothetical protein